MILAAVLASVALAGPGPVDASLRAGPYRVQVAVAPNRALRSGRLTVWIARGDRPLERARVNVTVRMLDMNMGSFTLAVPHTGLGRFSVATPAVGMSGHWGWRIVVAPSGAKPFSVAIVDLMGR